MQSTIYIAAWIPKTGLSMVLLQWTVVLGQSYCCYYKIMIRLGHLNCSIHSCWSHGACVKLCMIYQWLFHPWGAHGVVSMIFQWLMVLFYVCTPWWFVSAKNRVPVGCQYSSISKHVCVKCSKFQCPCFVLLGCLGILNNSMFCKLLPIQIKLVNC